MEKKKKNRIELFSVFSISYRYMNIGVTYVTEYRIS